MKYYKTDIIIFYLFLLWVTTWFIGYMEQFQTIIDLFYCIILVVLFPFACKQTLDKDKKDRYKSLIFASTLTIVLPISMKIAIYLSRGYDYMPDALELTGFGFSIQSLYFLYRVHTTRKSIS